MQEITLSTIKFKALSLENFPKFVENILNFYFCLIST